MSKSMSRTGIAYLKHVFNPAGGCTHISPGCENCYAEDLHTKRHCAYKTGKKMSECYSQPFDKIRLFPERLNQPLHVRKPSVVGVCFMSDLFHDEVPFEFIDRVMAVIAATPRHTYIILTKRSERMKEYFDSAELRVLKLLLEKHPAWKTEFSWPLKNLGGGVSVENQDMPDERVPILLQTNLAWRWLSVEPMLEPIDIEDYLTERDCVLCDPSECDAYGDSECREVGNLPEAKINGVVCGCEAVNRKPGRHIDIKAIRSLRDQCVENDTPFFLKQMEIDGKLVEMPELDGRKWDQMPEVIHGM